MGKKMPYHVISEKNASKLQQKNATYSAAKEPFPLSETSKRSPSQTTNRNKLLPGRQTLHTSLVIPPVRSKS